jgi:hypothetical protein
VIDGNGNRDRNNGLGGRRVTLEAGPIEDSLLLEREEHEGRLPGYHQFGLRLAAWRRVPDQDIVWMTDCYHVIVGTVVLDLALQKHESADVVG